MGKISLWILKKPFNGQKLDKISLTAKKEMKSLNQFKNLIFHIITRYIEVEVRTVFLVSLPSKQKRLANKANLTLSFTSPLYVYPISLSALFRSLRYHTYKGLCTKTHKRSRFTRGTSGFRYCPLRSECGQGYGGGFGKRLALGFSRGPGGRVGNVCRPPNAPEQPRWPARRPALPTSLALGGLGSLALAAAGCAAGCTAGAQAAVEALAFGVAGRRGRPTAERRRGRRRRRRRHHRRTLV